MTQMHPLRIRPAPAGDPPADPNGLVAEGSQALVIDVGFDPDSIDRAARERGWQVAAIVSTHGHFDHIAANAAARELWGAPLYMHAASVPIATSASVHAQWFGVECPDSPPPDHTLQHGDRLVVGRLEFEVRDTSGHCPGSISLYTPGHVFVGDALFAGSIGRVDLPHSDEKQLLTNLREQLMTLPDETVVYPGHGPTTTIGEERRHNPFLRAYGSSR
ncbi:MAG: MBL fold metallo-hydrolase [Armatimonadetes bacterium]|nr:MBL fold metallo-hydrolase [Armatimonadota bacterium]